MMYPITGVQEQLSFAYILIDRMTEYFNLIVGGILRVRVSL
jgi:hypothetical protein